MYTLFQNEWYTCQNARAALHLLWYKQNVASQLSPPASVEWGESRGEKNVWLIWPKICFFREIHVRAFLFLNTIYIPHPNPLHISIFPHLKTCHSQSHMNQKHLRSIDMTFSLFHPLLKIIMSEEMGSARDQTGISARRLIIITSCPLFLISHSQDLTRLGLLVTSPDQSLASQTHLTSAELTWVDI